jgi:hypothetical protein
MTLEIQILAYITTKYAFWYEKQNQKKMSKLRQGIMNLSINDYGQLNYSFIDIVVVTIPYHWMRLAKNVYSPIVCYINLRHLPT